MCANKETRPRTRLRSTVGGIGEDESEGPREAMRSMYTHIYMYVMYKYRAHIYEYVYVCIGNYTPRRHYMRL